MSRLQSGLKFLILTVSVCCPKTICWAHGGDHHDITPIQRLSVHESHDNSDGHEHEDSSKFGFNLLATDAQILRPIELNGSDLENRNKEKAVDAAVTYRMNRRHSFLLTGGASDITGIRDSSLTLLSVHPSYTVSGNLLTSMSVAAPLSEESREQKRILTLGGSVGALFNRGRWMTLAKALVSVPAYSGSSKKEEVAETEESEEGDHAEADHAETHPAELARLGPNVRTAYLIDKMLRLECAYEFAAISLRGENDMVFESDLTVAKLSYIDQGGWELGVSFHLVDESREFEAPDIPVSRLNLVVWN